MKAEDESVPRSVVRSTNEIGEIGAGSNLLSGGPGKGKGVTVMMRRRSTRHSNRNKWRRSTKKHEVQRTWMALTVPCAHCPLAWLDSGTIILISSKTPGFASKNFLALWRVIWCFVWRMLAGLAAQLFVMSPPLGPNRALQRTKYSAYEEQTRDSKGDTCMHTMTMKTSKRASNLPIPLCTDLGVSVCRCRRIRGGTTVIHDIGD